MHVITRSCVLFLWMHTLTFVKSQDCTREQFINGPLYDSNFDTSGLEASYSGGRQVRVGCNVGYSGFFKLICVEGKWVPTGNKCEPKSCGHPGDGQFSDFHLEKGDDFVFGSQVVYTCHKGYQMQSRTNYRRCMAEGWDGVVPVCEEVTCNRQVIENADIVNDKQEYKYNEQAAYVCKEGYQRHFTRTCTESGWTGPSRCTEVTCDREDIQNADIVNDKQVYKYNDQADYVCKEGYRGRFTRTCGDNGWTRPSQCTEITCNRQVIQNADIVNNKQKYKYNEQATYVCKEGYQRRFTRTCGDNGWTGPSQCTATACPNVEVSRGFVVGPYSGMLYYSCNEGYKLFTKAWWGQVKCKDVMLSEHVQCIEQRQCGEMPLIPNMEVTHQPKVYQHGERAQIICKKGYQAEEDSLTCREGKWHPNGPLKTICTPIASHCSPPPEVENAVIVNPYQKKYLSGSAVTYKCRDKYTMEGNDMIPCTDGKWDKNNIICSRPCTVDTEAMSQHNIDFGYNVGNKLYLTHGDRIQFRCIRGRTRVGERSMIQNCDDGVILLPSCQ